MSCQSASTLQAGYTAQIFALAQNIKPDLALISPLPKRDRQQSADLALGIGRDDSVTGPTRPDGFISKLSAPSEFKPWTFMSKVTKASFCEDRVAVDIFHMR